MVEQVLLDPLGRDRPLREQAAEDRGGGDREQQHQGGAHRAELAPGLLQQLAELRGLRSRLRFGPGGWRRLYGQLQPRGWDGRER